MELVDFSIDGLFSPVRTAQSLRTTKGEIATTLGLGRDSFSRKERIKARKTQKRLREMLEILNRVEPHIGSALIAYAWFRSEPLTGLGNQTPCQLVRAGRADLVHNWLDRVMAGGYA